MVSVSKMDSSGSKGGTKNAQVNAPGSPKRAKVASKPASPGRVARAADAKPYPTGKPASDAKAPTFRLPTPEEETSSIAESISGAPRVRRTEAERIKVFQDHPDCDEVEPHRVHCTRCNKWLSLGTKQTYATSPWEKHRESCDRKPPRDGNHSATPEADNHSASAGHSEHNVRRTEAERQSILESDPRAEQVLPNEVLCKKCQKWVKLSAKQLYALGNWNQHQQRCSGTLPSSRVATAERKLKLVNDSKAKSFTSRSVACLSCGVTVALDGEYVLTKWDEHKAKCSNHPVSAKPAGRRPPHSASATSEDTLVARSAPRGTKRSREPDEDEDKASQPAPYRARTENYVPPDKEAPSVLGWFLLPFQPFISGFRRGLNPSG